MADLLPQASPADGKPPGATAQPPPAHDGSTPQQAGSSEAQQNEPSGMQNNTFPGQAPHLQSTLTQGSPAQFAQQHQDQASTISPRPLENAAASQTTSTPADEKRDITMARGNASHANNNHAVHAPSNNYVPPQIRAGGAPARKYLNEKVVPYLLEGMKSLAQEQPADPLRALGEFLLQKSQEAGEGTAGTNPGDQMNT